MEETIDATIDEQILAELQALNVKFDNTLVILEDIRSDKETTLETAETEEITMETLNDYQQFIVDSSKVNITLSLCSLGVMLILLGSYLAKIVFRKM